MDEDTQTPAEEARSRERITFRRNPDLAGDFLELACPYAESEQEALRQVMAEEIKRAKRCCHKHDD